MELTRVERERISLAEAARCETNQRPHEEERERISLEEAARREANERPEEERARGDHRPAAECERRGDAHASGGVCGWGEGGHHRPGPGRVPHGVWRAAQRVV